MRDQLLQNQGKRRPPGIGKATDGKLPFDQGPTAASYVSQFTLYWAGRLSNYRYQLADELPTLFTDGKALPRLVTPATLDITNWLEYSEIDTTPLELEQQAILMSLIARKEYKNPLVHGFIGFDPWRYVDDVKKNHHPDALEVVKKALTQYGFVGVKLYPPMGFRAAANKGRPDSDFLPKLTADHKNSATSLDAALDELYQYCLANDVPIMAHCAASQGTSEANGLCADPQYWKQVLDKPPAGNLDYSKLRLNLGHFGGIWNFDGEPQSSTHIVWTQFVVDEMIKSGRYPNLYTDIGDFSAVLDRSDGEIIQEQAILKKLADLITGLRSAETPGDVRLGLDILRHRAGLRGLLRADAQSFGPAARAERPHDGEFPMAEFGALPGARDEFGYADAGPPPRVLHGERPRSHGPRALPGAAGVRGPSCRKITRRRRRLTQAPERHADASWSSARTCAAIGPSAVRATCCSRWPDCTSRR